MADPEYAAIEAEFIYGRNRLNVAITRACLKSMPWEVVQKCGFSSSRNSKAAVRSFMPDDKLARSIAAPTPRRDQQAALAGLVPAGLESATAKAGELTAKAQRSR